MTQYGGTNLIQYKIGSVKTKFYNDIKKGHWCGNRRLTKTEIKRIASKCNRLLIKKDSRLELWD
jgi:hypothetical protein